MATLPTCIATTNTNHKLLPTKVPTFRGKNWFNIFEHFLRNHLQPFSNRITEEAKLQQFQTSLRQEAVEIFKSLTISTKTTLTDVLLKKEVHQRRFEKRSKIQMGSGEV